MSRDPIVLVGGGIGGLTAAIALARRGVAAVVLEQADAFAAVGAGLQLAPNATRVLTALGLGDALARIGFAPEAAEVRDSADGALLLRTALGGHAVTRWGSPYLQVHRAELQAALLVHARALGVDIRTGAPVEGVSQDAAGAWVHTPGAEVRGAAVVGCDGVRSRLRDLLFGPSPARFTGQAAWRALVAADGLAHRVPPTAAVWVGSGRHLVNYFVGAGTLVNLVGVVDDRSADVESWSAEGDPKAMAANFAGWPQPVFALLDAVRTCWRWPIYDRPPLARWSKGRIGLLGDAAHPAPPFLAQGAGMAIEDAFALAEHLAADVPPAQALESYCRSRSGRTARVRAWARRNGVLFHLPRVVRRPAFAVARSLGERGNAAPQLDWLYGR